MVYLLVECWVADISIFMFRDVFFFSMFQVIQCQVVIAIIQ